MMKLQDVHPGIRWGAVVALFVGLTQFNTGIKLIYSKWTADEAAAEAKKVAVEAKETAKGVDERFDRYIEQQKQAIETQNKIAEAIQGYTAKQQTQQQSIVDLMANQLHPAAGPTPLVREEDPQGREWCCATTSDECWDRQTWTQCD